MTYLRFLGLGIALLVLGSATAQDTTESKPLVHPLFTDHMVLQRDQEVPIWGWAKPGTKVAVSMNGQAGVGTADASGKWAAKLGPFPAGGTHTLKIEGPETIQINDVVMGDVWICSGQSNMEWSVQASNNAKEEVAAANYPRIRLFTVPKRVSSLPQETVDAKWVVCSQDTIATFSAVGYYFGRYLHRELNVPIGLIHTSWGGTIAEAWTSAEALKTMPDFQPAVEEFQRTAAEQKAGKFDLAKRVAEWWEKNDAGSDGAMAWSKSSYGHADWKTMKLPSNWETANVGLNDFDGIVWFRREFDLPPSWNGKDAVLSLGPIDDVDTTWVNGHRVGSMQVWNEARTYKVAAEHLKPGRNVIAIRVYDNQGGGGIFGEAKDMALRLADEQAKSISLAGNWPYKVSTPKKKLTPFPQQFGNNPNTVTVLYNGMLAPLADYGITGAIWYQGESNAGRPMQYRRLLPTMIEDWRNRFGQGDFPFLVVQLANFLEPQKLPVQSGWAELREAQFLTAQRDKNVGLAVITDIGEAGDIHPKNKQDVGKRLALQALKIAYKEDLVHSGPTMAGMSIVGDTLHIDFDNTGSGLIAKGEALEGFAIAEREGDFVWANAEIKDDTVVLSHADLAEPIRVRYGWANNPIGNLFSKDGLPAGPFRTDVPRTTIPQSTSESSRELTAAKPEAVGMSAEKLALVKPALQKFVDDDQVPGAIVIAAKDGKVVLFESVGYGDIAEKKPMEKDSILRFYSMTKAITSVSIMMLVEEGKIELEDRVSKHVPELAGLKVFAGRDGDELKLEEPTREMTIRDLLRHTSGLTYGFFGETAVDLQYRRASVLSRSDTLQDTVDKLGKLPLLYQPGTRFNYSVSTDLLGHIIEKVSQQRLDEFFQTRVFDPLGMRDTGFHVDAKEIDRFANNYGPGADGLKIIDAAATSRYLKPPKLFSGGGGLVSTASDYMRFCQMLLNKGELNGERLLEDGTVEQMTRNQLSKAAYPVNLNGRRDGVGFGLGFSVVVEKTPHTADAQIGEYGWGGAASTHFWISPNDNLAVVVLTQHMPFSFRLENAVKPLVYDAIIK